MDDLFDNAMVRQALKGMTPEQLEHYQKIGEKMYNTIDFEKGDILDKESSDEEMLSYITHALKSGLHPKDLEVYELEFLSKIYGDKWYEKFGYTLNDIEDAALSHLEKLKETKEVIDIPKKERISRNDKCPCNSNKKYKYCCLNK